MFYLGFLLIIRIFGKKKESAEWDGPVQTPEELKKASHFMTDHLTQYYPTSAELIKAYPEEAQQARAIRRYKEIEALKEAGKIDEIDYNIELEKILPLMNTTDLFEK